MHTFYSVLLFVSFAIIGTIIAEPKCGYESCPKGEPGKLNVHLVCHTHDDVGWLKTVDQYFYGANQSIQRAGVQYILDTVIDSLSNDPSKKFIYVETAFFWRWWNEQHDFVRHKVQKLVRDSQLEFIGGGWSMNDEAATHYNSIIDQMTWGLRRLTDIFGQCGVPKVAWQIDPFGHSREQASLFAQMYFDGLFFGRLDYQDKDQRMETKTMEHIWKGSDNLGPLAELFTGALPNSYSPPAGFCFDLLCDDPPIMDDRKLKNYNVEERVSTFIKIAQEQAKSYATNHLIMTMGNDFNYQSAGAWYKNLDKLIKYVNQKQVNGSQVNVFYSTPSCYLYALNQAKQAWSTKNDDFFPYASDPHAYWTGYFTSRPAIKRFERYGNNFLQVCKQLTALADLEDFDLISLREAMGIMQHHDAVTGTEKQHVNNDYTQTLSEGIANCQISVNDAYKKLLPKASSTEIPTQIFCNYLNISECNITESDKPVVVTIYNPLAWQLSTYIHLPVSGNAYKIIGPDGNAVETQIVSIPPAILNLPGRSSKAISEVIFKADLPPLGYSVYLVRKSTNKLANQEQESTVIPKKGDWSISNEYITVIVDGKTGLLRGLQLTDGTSLSVKQSFYWYRGMDGNNTQFQFRASGAYIFRPNGTDPIPLGNNVSVSAINGSLVQEIRQDFTPWLSQTIRLYKGVEHIEFDWVVGPIPVADKIGKEIITRFDTDIKPESGAFYTDANGREIQKRIRNFRPTWKLNITEPISGNYYPVNSRIFIRDEQNRRQMTILTDRSQGGSSIKDGSVELMIHRRLLHDDAFGVGEALNEPGVDGKGLVIRGSHYLIFSNIIYASRKHRALAQRLFMQPQLSFALYNSSEIDFFKTVNVQFSGLTKALPPNVHLLTLEPWKKATKLIRLEHIFEFDDDPIYSKPVTLSMKGLFSDFEIVSLNETTLGANQFLVNATRLQWISREDNLLNEVLRAAGKLNEKASIKDFDVSLVPMRIRTFIAEVQYNQHRK